MSATVESPRSRNVGACLRAILLAAGRGSRMKGSVADKILVPVEGASSFRRSHDAFAATGLFDSLVVVYRDEPQREALAAELPEEGPPVLWIAGGNRRQDSVFHGLTEAGLETDYVFIHDCARPLVRPGDIERLWEAVLRDKAAALARPVTDTIKKIHRRRTHFRKCALRDLDRRTLWATETPQAFAYQPFFDACQKTRQEPGGHTDDASIASASGIKVSLVEPSAPNPKITRPEDLDYAAFLLRRAASEPGGSP